MSVDTSNAQATAGVETARARVAGAIKQAANSTGASFQYLLATAKMESDFNPSAGASTSSAHGLYQFIEQTWLGTVKEAGSQLGYGQYADAISKTSSGDYTISDPTMRKEIMKLRGELYMAHFMGVGGAAKLINNAEDNPKASAAWLFPNAAAANRSIFYDRQGSARSVSEVYSVLTSRYAGAANSQATQTALAMYGNTAPATAVASAAAPASSIDNAAYLSTFPNVGAAVPVTVASNSTSVGDPSSSVPVFRSLFQVDDQSQPVSSTVRALWGNSASLASVASADATSQATNGGAPQPLDLFSDRNGTFSS